MKEILFYFYYYTINIFYCGFFFCFCGSYFGTRKKKICGRQTISQAEASAEHPLEIIRNCQTAHRRLCSPEIPKLVYYSALNLKDNQRSSIYTCRNFAGFHLLKFWWKRRGLLDVRTALASFKTKSRHCSSVHKKYLGNGSPVPPGVVTEAGNPSSKKKCFGL